MKNTMTAIEIAANYSKDKKYVLLNDFLFHMRMQYNIMMTNKEAADLLFSLGYQRKRIAFDTYDGGKQSRNEFINDLPNQPKPIVGEMITQGTAFRILVRKILKYLKTKLENDELEKSGIINFNLFNSDEGLILLFDNSSLKNILKDIMNDFNYDENAIVQLSTYIRHISEVSYVRENRYNGNTRNAVDKKFYKYTFKKDEDDVEEK